jgi:hypothetical protein
VATFFIIRGVGGIADSLEERMERVGERDERIGQNLLGSEAMAALVGGAVALYGSICYMAYSLTSHAGNQSTNRKIRK